MHWKILFDSYYCIISTKYSSKFAEIWHYILSLVHKSTYGWNFSLIFVFQLKIESLFLLKARKQKWFNLSFSFCFQINNSPIESLSLVEARKLLEKSKDKLQLIITKKKFEESPHKRQNSLPKDDGKYRLTNSSTFSWSFSFNSFVKFYCEFHGKKNLELQQGHVSFHIE